MLEDLDGSSVLGSPLLQIMPLTRGGFPGRAARSSFPWTTLFVCLASVVLHGGTNTEAPSASERARMRPNASEQIEAWDSWDLEHLKAAREKNDFFRVRFGRFPVYFVFKAVSSCRTISMIGDQLPPKS